jgi:aspartate-semialdehyde dehydrogenase
MDPSVPLVVPEINARRIADHKGIIANPNCSAITALVPLWQADGFHLLGEAVVLERA